MARCWPLCAGLAFALWGFGAQAADFPARAAPCESLDPRCEVAAAPTPPAPTRHRLQWVELWGYAGLQGFFTGERMAPNGIPFTPIFALDSSFNLGILPDQKLYLFIDSKFWMQKAGPGITNPTQGQWDFSKREFDYLIGVAYNYWGPLELRLSTYSHANLNRGTTLERPFGFRDGTHIENRYYFHAPDRYDIGRSSFVAVGYYPSKGMAGGDGHEFQPGLSARGYGAYDLPFWGSYLYLDANFITDRNFKPRLLEFDGGWAVRPIPKVQNVEFRIGGNILTDLGPDTRRHLVYSAARFVY